MSTSTTADIRAAMRDGRSDLAERQAAALLGDVVGSRVVDVTIRRDPYSLNSVNGLLRTDAGEALFFKFHQEEGEESSVSEYYNAQVLQDAGYPVTMPLYQESTPGRQVVVYPRVDSPRLSDVCSALDAGEDDGDFSVKEVIETQRLADQSFARIALDSLRHEPGAAACAQPLFQLFYNRLVDDPGTFKPQPLGGRFATFYRGQMVNWPGLTAPFDELAELPWTINGIDYPDTLSECFTRAAALLSPPEWLPGPVVTAHGDAHNANVWLQAGAAGQPPTLCLFDPAFAGNAIPALLAEVKATFHNVFAHPFWLYEPERCARRYSAGAEIRNGRLCVDTNYTLSPLRKAFLHSKATDFWAPLLAALKRHNQLPDDWEARVRIGLFACPTLVMRLLSGDGSAHNPVSSLIGFAQAIRAAGAPLAGAEDDFVRFFDLARQGVLSTPEIEETRRHV